MFVVFSVHLIFRFYSSWVVPVFLLEYCMITFRIWCLPFVLFFNVLYVICKLHNIWPHLNIPFYLFPPIVYKLSFIWGHTLLVMEWHLVSHGRFLDNHRMNTLWVFWKSKFAIIVFECWILLTPVLGAVACTLNQIKPATS